MPRSSALLLLPFLALSSLPAQVHAQPLTSEDLLALEEEQTHRGYWHASLLGGIVIPTDHMGETFKEGIAANLRVGYTSYSGLGMILGATYSPLSTKAMAPSLETHLAMVAAAPRFTIGRDFVRMWFGAGGGVAVEMEKSAGTSQTNAEPMAMGEAGLEFHVFGGGGLSVQGNYVRSFGGGLDARLFSALTGLVFTF